ncbi:MAG: hypothetical protein ACRDRX_02055 [Pseudonocardiaceae bacterium]
MPERIALHSVRQIGELQERAARAVPATVQENRDGCWLRYTDSMTTWWAGAVLMHGHEQVRDLAARIAVAEDFYAAHGAPARFKCVLPARPISTTHYPFAGTGGAMSCPSRWLPRGASRVACRHHHRGSTSRSIRTRYATAVISGRPVAVGRAVADTGWAGVFGMATLPDARQQGAASAVLATLC